MRNLVLFFLVAAAVGCQSKSETAATSHESQPSQPAAPAPSTPAPPTAAPGETGVAECDDYLRKWDACLATKITGEAHEQVKVALDATREGWKLCLTTGRSTFGKSAWLWRLISWNGLRLNCEVGTLAVMASTAEESVSAQASGITMLQEPGPQEVSVATGWCLTRK